MNATRFSYFGLFEMECPMLSAISFVVLKDNSLC